MICVSKIKCKWDFKNVVFPISKYITNYLFYNVLRDDEKINMLSLFYRAAFYISKRFFCIRNCASIFFQFI